MFKLKELFQFVRAFLCVAGCISFVFNFAGVSAQTKRVNNVKQGPAQLGGPLVTSTLSDSFIDADSNGRADTGSEITYTATVTNSGTTDAVNVSYTNPIDANSTLVPNSVQVQSDLSSYVIRCTFGTGGGGTGGCSAPSAAYAVNDPASRFTLIGGNLNTINVVTSNVMYNTESSVFAFDANVQNLISNSLGTLDGRTADPAGVRLFVQNLNVDSGNGSVSASNADGSAFFTAANQPYFQYNQMLAQDEYSNSKTLEFAVPPTVNSFTVDFLVYTRAQLKLVINEVLVNPGGSIFDANGEWFEVYNAGAFPIQMQNLLINDYSASGSVGGDYVDDNHRGRPVHTIASSLLVQPGAYVTLGNTTNTTNNGGVPIDYAYGPALQLANSLDGVRIAAPPEMNPTPGTPLSLDIAIYLNPGISAQNGISRELKNPALPPTINPSNVAVRDMDGSDWADALVTSVYGPGGRGTPKAQNGTYTPFAATVAKATASRKTANVTNLADTVSVNLGTIPAGGSIVVTYRVTVTNPMPAGVTQVSSQSTVAGDNFGAVMSDDPATPAANDATMTPVGLAPTAALVSVSGKVSDSMGRAIQGAQVMIYDSGETHAARTNSFGYYQVSGITAGSTVVASVSHKRYVFAPQVLSVSDSISNLNFTAGNFSLY